MAPARPSRKSLVSRRRRADGDEDEEELVAGIDDSQSDTSVASDLDHTGDVDVSELSDTDTTEHRHADPTRLQPAVTETKARRRSDGDHTSPITISNGTDPPDDKDGALSTSTNVAAAPAGAPIVSSQTASARNPETTADRRRRDHDDYKKKRDSDPTFIPNRGNFFMHDARTPDQRGFASNSRGKGRGRALAQAPTNHAPLVERTADAPWAHDLHDLHETINEQRGAYPGPRQRPFGRAGPNADNNPQGCAPRRPLNFSQTKQIGSVQIRVSLPGMKAAVPFPAVTVKSYTRLPDHRPPLRRDKPVRVSLPDHAVRYVFPAAERSFIFIPRAMRPNQQGFGKARGSFGTYGAPQSRRTSVYGGSVYSQAMSMSRRSSLARDIPRESAFSPTGSYTARGHPGSGRPVVHLPPSHRSSNPSPAGSAYGRSYVYSYPRPQTPAVEHWADPDTVHQPRPQKTISMTGIESPAAALALHAPQQQEQLPFHNQLPQHISEGSISTQSASSDTAPPPLGPPTYMYAGSTPLSNIPERAIHAQPFQPPASSYYQQYAPSEVYYPGQTPQYAAAPSYVPSAAQTGYMPAEMAVDPGMVAHESNGMVFYSHMPQYAPQDGYLHPQSYAVPGMGGMMTPSPEGAYYYPPSGPMYYQA